MPDTIYRGRKAVEISNGTLTLTVTVEGGHIARIQHAAVEMNPLWTPHWSSVEPSAFDPAIHTGYGGDAEARLLAGIFGHNLCLDLFGGPSGAEASTGMSVHGESSIDPYRTRSTADALTQEATFPHAQLHFRREIRLVEATAIIRETVTNLSAWDRPSAWTQHVSLGAPFVEPGVTRFRITATRSKVFEENFAAGGGYMVNAAEFDWPMVPGVSGEPFDLRVYPSASASAAYTAHLMDPSLDLSWFIAHHPGAELACAYVWKQTDFPWLGRWEENRHRSAAPWNHREITCGMEFGVSPMPETRRKMIERGSMFGVPGYRWLPAKESVTVEYRATVQPVTRTPERAEWTESGVQLA